MSQILYNKRTWLNELDSHYTGSIVCSDIQDLINRGKHMDRHIFVELCDCYGKIRIHPDSNHDTKEFVQKLRTIQQELEQFIQHLEENP